MSLRGGLRRSRGSRLLSVLAEPGVDHSLVKSAHYADLTEDPATGARRWWRRYAGSILLGVSGDWTVNPFPGLHPLDANEHPT